MRFISRFKLLCTIVALVSSVAANAETTEGKAEVFVQMGHSSSVLALTVSPDGRTIVTGSADQTLKLWDAASGRELRTLSGHGTLVNAVAISPDGQTIVSGGNGSPLKLWDAVSGRELQTIGTSSFVNAVAFSPDGHTIVSGGYETIAGGMFSRGGNQGAFLKLWDSASGQLLKTLMQPQGVDNNKVNAVAFSPDGHTIVSGSADGTLKLWDTASGRELHTLSGHSSEINKNEENAFAGAQDALRQLQNASPIIRSATTGSVTAVAFSHDGHTIVSSSKDKTLKLWDVNSGRELQTLSGHKEEITSVAFSPDGHTIVSGSKDNTLKLWDVSSARELQTIDTSTGYVTALAFSPDGHTIIAGNTGTNIDLWNAASGQKLRTLGGQGARVEAVAFSPDGSTIVSSGYKSISKSGMNGGTLNLWDAVNGIKLKTMGGPGFNFDTHAMAFSPDGRTIVSAMENSYRTSVNAGKEILKLWDVASGLELKVLKGHDDNIHNNNYIWALAFSPDGHTIVSAYHDNIKLWDAVSGQVLQTIDTTYFPLSLAVSPDSRTIVTGGSYLGNGKGTDVTGLNLWDVASGRHLPTTINHGSLVQAVAFSPDGRTIASGGSTTNPDFDIKLWDASSGSELRTLRWHSETSKTDVATLTKMYQSVATALVFSPDGRTLASTHKDTIRLWDTASGHELHTLGGHNVDVSAAAFSPNGKNVIYGSADGTVHQCDVKTGKETAQFVSFANGEWATITAEGYYNTSSNGHKLLNIRANGKVTGIDQFYDVFYRPDIVQAKLKGEDISSLITLTIDDALKSPPPSVAFTTVPQKTDQSKAKVCYKASSTGGGIGEVRLFQNGKLVKSDGFYRESAASKNDEKIQLASQDSATIQRDLRNLKVVQNAPSPIISNDKGKEFEECQELETLPGENEISVAAFNAPNTIQSTLETASFKVDRKPEEPHLYVLGVGIDHYAESSVDLQFAAKDANDFRAMIKQKAVGLYKPQNIHIEGLSDKAANKEGIQKAIQALSGKVKPWDSFIFFVASHGVLQENQYYIVTAGYNGTMNTANFISSNEIVGMSKNITALSQLFIFDTCHAGGVDNLISGLYDARMSVIAKKMGLHIYASAGSTQTAMDGYQGNGLFTHTLLKSMREGKATDTNHDGQVSVMELGERARQETMAISKKLGEQQSPNIINFGRDNALFRVQ